MARVMSKAETDEDGRVPALLPRTSRPACAGAYRLTFDVGDYFQRARRGVVLRQGRRSTSSSATPTAHYHVPLLLSPYGYSTYRGS